MYLIIASKLRRLRLVDVCSIGRRLPVTLPFGLLLVLEASASQPFESAAMADDSHENPIC